MLAIPDHTSEVEKPEAVMMSFKSVIWARTMMANIVMAKRAK